MPKKKSKSYIRAVLRRLGTPSGPVSNSWRKGGLAGYNNTRCVLGGFMDVLRENNIAFDGSIYEWENDPANEDAHAIHEAILEYYPRIVNSLGYLTSDYRGRDIASFNDHHDTVFEDVTRVLEKAAAKREEEGAESV